MSLLPNDPGDTIRRLEARLEVLERTPQKVATEAGDLRVTAATGIILGGWLDTDGAAYSRTTYARLFAAIGTTYGVGDGSTTFNVPDTRGRSVIGTGTGAGLTARALGVKVGAETHLLTAAQSGLPTHGHTIDHNHPAETFTSGGISVNHVHGGAAGTGEYLYRDSAYNTGYVIGTTNGALAVTWSATLNVQNNNHTHATTVDLANLTGTSGNVAASAASAAHPIMSPAIAMRCLIKS